MGIIKDVMASTIDKSDSFQYVKYLTVLLKEVENK